MLLDWNWTFSAEAIPVNVNRPSRKGSGLISIFHVQEWWTNTVPCPATLSCCAQAWRMHLPISLVEAGFGDAGDTSKHRWLFSKSQLQRFAVSVGFRESAIRSEIHFHPGCASLFSVCGRILSSLVLRHLCGLGVWKSENPVRKLACVSSAICKAVVEGDLTCSTAVRLSAPLTPF